MADSGFIKGDQLPDIRGLLHIKNDIELKLFSKNEEKQNLLLILWSQNYKQLPSFLDDMNQIIKETGLKCYAINTDKVFLYNESM